MFASRRDDADDDVRERFIRVVGLPEERIVGLPEERVVGLPEEEEIGAGSPEAEEIGAPPTPGAADPPEGTASTGPAGLRRVLGAFDPGLRGVRALAAVAVVAVAVAGFLAWRARPQVEPAGTGAQPSAAGPFSGPSGGPSVGPSGALVVAVTGRVRRPGLVRLPSGARVADAIESAGGVLPDTDLSFVNLARKLADGELVTIGINSPPGVAVGPGGTGPGGAGPGAGPLNLNTATAAQFEALPGIGPVLAQHIVDYRTRHGQFRSVDELRQVEGLGSARFAQLKPLVTV
jgi:competence protein ComEA